MKKKTIIILVSITGSVIGLVLVSLIMVVTLSERSVRYLSLDDDEVKFSGNPDEDGVYVKDLKLQSFWNKVSIMITLKPNAQGTLTVPDGRKYVGEFKDGDPHGQGTYTFPDGAKYVGEYKDGERHGRGTYTSPDGTKYVGDWQDGNWHGQGIFTFPDGRKYVGEFKDGEYHGQGTLTLPDGRKYVGGWRDNKPWNGTRYDKHGNVVGTIKNGVWKKR